MKNRNNKGRINGPFVALRYEVLDSKAFAAMSHGAQMLYVRLRAKLSNDGRNNGGVYVSQRQAMKKLGSGSNEIARWYRELQHYGFIVMTKGGSLGVDGWGKAPHWRLTEAIHGFDVPTRDFEKWDGLPFVDRPILRGPRPKKTESRNGKALHPVTEKHHIRRPAKPAPAPESVTENHYISGREGVTDSHYISSIPSPSVSPATSPLADPTPLVSALALAWTTPILLEVTVEEGAA
jgi:hypothetical protein